MIYRTMFMDDNERCNYSQKNNSIEALLDDFETCGPTSDISGLNSVGYNTHLVDGVQEEDIATCFLLNPNNYEAFLNIREDIDPASVNGNRIPQYYPYMNMILFGAKSKFAFGNVQTLCIENLKLRRAVHLCYRRGHFVVAVGYDTGSKQIIYNDPIEGFNLKFKVSEFLDFENFVTAIYPKAE